MIGHRLNLRSSAPLLLGLGVTLGPAMPVRTARAEPIALAKSTMDGGGVSFVSAGSFTLGGTIGQPDAGTLSAGNFTLNGGFWWGGTAVVGVGDDDGKPPADPTPLAFRLYPSAPNPLGLAARVAFDLPEARRVVLRVYGVDGRLVRSLIEAQMPAGRHTLVWDAADDRGRRVASGVYLLQLEAGDSGARHKLVVLR